MLSIGEHVMVRNSVHNVSTIYTEGTRLIPGISGHKHIIICRNLGWNQKGRTTWFICHASTHTVIVPFQVELNNLRAYPAVAEGGEEPLAPVETALLHLIAVFFLTRFLRMIQGTLLDYQLGQKSSKVTLPKLRTFLHIASCSHGHAFLELQYTHLDTEKHATPALRPPQSSTHQKILRPCNLLNDEALWI